MVTTPTIMFCSDNCIFSFVSRSQNEKIQNRTKKSLKIEKKIKKMIQRL